MLEGFEGMDADSVSRTWTSAAYSAAGIMYKFSPSHGYFILTRKYQKTKPINIDCCFSTVKRQIIFWGGGGGVGFERLGKVSTIVVDTISAPLKSKEAIVSTVYL